jgi:hypothetical protein
MPPMSIHQTEDNRFGGRATIQQPGVLEIGGKTIPGVIRDVGLQGVFFATPYAPATGTTGTLRRYGGKGIAVRVVRRAETGSPGVGLAFDSVEN